MKIGKINKLLLHFSLLMVFDVAYAAQPLPWSDSSAKSVISKKIKGEAAETENLQSQEHKYLGDSVKIAFPTVKAFPTSPRALKKVGFCDRDPQQPYCSKNGYVKVLSGNTVTLMSFNNTRVSFGDMIYLTGDLVGKSGEENVIGLAKTLDEQASRFYSQMSAFTDSNMRQRIPFFQQVVNEYYAKNLNNGWIDKGRTLEFLDGGSFGCTQDGQLSEVSNTGRASTSLVPIFQDTRGCSSAAMLRSTPYLELAKTNYDHFGNYAITAYLTAHKEALLVASQAESENGYKVALAMEGFADHYLTDLYAGGHLRVPRKEIVDYCRRVVSVVPDGLYQLLTKKMHDYDGKNGILIVLNSGQKTFAYGDDYFAVMGNQLNSIALRTALQASLDQVYAAYYLAQANRTSLNSSVVNFKREKLINDLMQQANLYLPNIKATFEENQSLRQPLFLIKDNGTGQIILPGNATNRGYTVYMLDGANYVPLSCNTVATGGVVNN